MCRSLLTHLLQPVIVQGHPVRGVRTLVKNEIESAVFMFTCVRHQRSGSCSRDQSLLLSASVFRRIHARLAMRVLLSIIIARVCEFATEVVESRRRREVDALQRRRLPLDVSEHAESEAKAASASAHAHT